MPAGYVRIWISLGAAVEHVQRVAECDAREASEALLAALKDGLLRGRLAGGDQPLSVRHWYHATIYADGLVGLWEPPPAGLEPEHRLVEIHRGDLEAIWPGQKSQPQADTDAPDPNERLTLPEQVRLLARTMPEERARARIDKAFRFKEISYQPQFAFLYDDARIDWATGRVILRRLQRQPFTPTLTAAEFFRHFMPSRQASAEPPQAARLSLGDPTADACEAQDVTAERAADHNALTRSGFPGRPGKSKHLIEDEFRRRMGADEALPSTSDEAGALLVWLIKEHPTVARPTLKTIENNIRTDRRRWKASRQAEASSKPST